MPYFSPRMAGTSLGWIHPASRLKTPLPWLKRAAFLCWVSSSKHRESRASLQAPSKELTQKLPGLWLLQVDLEHSTLPAGQFELVICFNYLQRSLFSAIEAALRPGGMLVYETYTLDQLAFPKGPRKIG